MMENIEIKKEIIYYGMHDSDDSLKIKNLIDRIKNFAKNLNLKK